MAASFGAAVGIAADRVWWRNHRQPGRDPRLSGAVHGDRADCQCAWAGTAARTHCTTDCNSGCAWGPCWSPGGRRPDGLLRLAASWAQPTRAGRRGARPEERRGGEPAPTQVRTCGTATTTPTSRAWVALHLEPADESPTLDEIAARAGPACSARCSLAASPAFPPAVWWRVGRKRIGAWRAAGLVAQQCDGPVGWRAQWPDGEGAIAGRSPHATLCDERNWTSGVHGGWRPVREGLLHGAGRHCMSEAPLHLLHTQPTHGCWPPGWRSRHARHERQPSDLGDALHGLLRAAFGDAAPQPFRYLDERQGLLAYTRLDATPCGPSGAGRSAGGADAGSWAQTGSMRAIACGHFPPSGRRAMRSDFEVRVRPTVRAAKGERMPSCMPWSRRRAHPGSPGRLCAMAARASCPARRCHARSVARSGRFAGDVHLAGYQRLAGRAAHTGRWQARARRGRVIDGPDALLKGHLRVRGPGSICATAGARRRSAPRLRFWHAAAEPARLKGAHMLKGRLGLEKARIPHADRHGLLWLSRGELCVIDGCLHFMRGQGQPDAVDGPDPAPGGVDDPAGARAAASRTTRCACWHATAR